MREEKLSRLSGFTVTKRNLTYLHYKYLHKDITQAINKFAKGKVLDIGCGNKPYEKLFEGKNN
ncbi:MAG: hypothetical protein WDM90_08385 [Ferruginibacter sp.]